MNTRIRLQTLARVLAVGMAIAALCESSAWANSPDVSALVGDGKTDNTAQLSALLASGERSLVIPAGDFVTGKIEIPSNFTLTLSPGAILRDSGRLQPADSMLTIKGENVRIVGTGAKCVANRNDYTTGEHRHGVLIWGAHNVTIVGLETYGQGGDGFYIGGPHGNPSQSIVLDHVIADYNRRNGLSITSAKGVDVISSTFADTHGTKPEFGVDVEPNDPQGVIQDIHITDLHTLRNVVGGFRAELFRLNGTSVPVSIVVSGHNSKNDGVTVSLESNASAPGLVQYSDATSLNATDSGIRLVDPYVGGVRFELSDININGSNAAGGSDPSVSSAIVVRRRPYDKVKGTFGNATLRNVTVVPAENGPRNPYGVYIEGPRRFGDRWNGLKVENLKISGMPQQQD